MQRDQKNPPDGYWLGAQYAQTRSLARSLGERQTNPYRDWADRGASNRFESLAMQEEEQEEEQEEQNW